VEQLESQGEHELETVKNYPLGQVPAERHVFEAISHVYIGVQRVVYIFVIKLLD
jgi:hypothetical protein